MGEARWPGEALDVGPFRLQAGIELEGGKWRGVIVVSQRGPQGAVSADVAELLGRALVAQARVARRAARAASSEKLSSRTAMELASLLASEKR
jgi:hypothetical protein